jgi:hypothetical protein
MPRRVVLFLAALSAACGPEQGHPPGSDDTGEPEGILCPSAWTEHDGGVWLQPTACLAWSPRAAEPMDWYAAVSPEEAVAGGCGANCDDDPGYCSELGAVGGLEGWRLPSRSELQDAGFAGPPLEPLDEPLWSRDSSSAMESMALQVDLSTPELELLMGKDQDGQVRCVVDL